MPTRKVLNLHNGFNLSELKKLKKSKPEIFKYLKKRKIPLKKDLLLSFARADEYKGLDIALEAMIKISEKRDLIPIIIASKFSDEEIIKKIENKLRMISVNAKIKPLLFFGYEFTLPKYLVQHNKVRALVNLPTKDFSPLSPHESQIIGHDELCIINSDIDCFRAIIKDGDNGFLCQPESDKATMKLEKVLALTKKQKRSIVKRNKKILATKMNLAKNYYQGLKTITK